MGDGPENIDVHASIHLALQAHNYQGQIWNLLGLTVELGTSYVVPRPPP